MKAISLMGPLMTPYTAVMHRPRQPVPHRPRYTPPMIAGPSPAKKLSGFDIEAIPVSVVLGAVGVGVMYLSSIAPTPLKQILFGTGLFGIAWGILELFPQEAHAGISPSRKKAPPGEEVPVETPPGHLADLLELTFPRNQPNVGGRYRGLYWDQKYEFAVTNNWSTPHTFFVGITFFDNDSDLTKIWESPKREAPSAGGRKEVRVRAGKTVEDTVTVPALGPDFIWLPNDAVIAELQLFEERDSPRPFMVSVPIPITFTTLG